MRKAGLFLMIKPAGTPFDDPFEGIPDGVEGAEHEDEEVFPPGEEPFSLDEFEAGRTKVVVGEQVRQGLEGLSEEDG